MKKHMLPILVLFAGTLQAQNTHDLEVKNDQFMPEFLVVEAGDSIALQLTAGHTLTEVSAATFRANGIVPNGGLRIGAGLGHGFQGTDADRTTFTLNEPGDHYFVSEGTSGAPAKTHILVIPSKNTGITATVDRSKPTVFPNPADDQVRFGAHGHLEMMTVEAFDQGGRRVLHSVVRGNEPLNLRSLPQGLYTLRLSDGLSTVYGVERLVIDRVDEGAL